MLIEIFEARGFTEPKTDLDTLILNLHNKYTDKVMLQKIDVLDSNAMKKHRDIVKIIKDKGLDTLPLIKLDKKIVSQEKLEQLMR